MLCRFLSRNSDVQVSRRRLVVVSLDMLSGMAFEVHVQRGGLLQSGEQDPAQQHS